MRPRLCFPGLLLCFATRSFAIIDATSTTNISDPGGGVPWASVGRVNNASGEYLGNGWVLTAHHVGAGAITFDSGTYQPDGRAIRLTNPSDNSPTDLLLYHLVLTPSLPAIPLSSSTPIPGSAVDMVGFGRIRGSDEQTYGPYTGFDWSAYGSKSYGTNQVQTGLRTENFGHGDLKVFVLEFSPPGFLPTAREGQVAPGDSGGAVFHNNGGTWELAGMINAHASYVLGQNASTYGDWSYIADMATYKDQINSTVAAVWNGTSGTAWAAANNWSATLLPGTGYKVTFNNGGNGHTTVNLAGGATINTVLFDSASAAGYTIGSGAPGSQTLTLNNGGAIKTSSTVANSQLLNAALTLGDDATAQTYTISNNAAPSANPSLTLAGGIAGATGGTAGAKTLAVTGNGHTAITGGISTGGAASLAVTKTGSGTLALSGTQTYATLSTSGGTTNVNSALGSGSSSVSVSGSGTTLKFGSVSQTLSALTIGAGATVSFTSAPASLTGSDGAKAPSFGPGPPAAGAVPEPGTTGLLLAGALSILSSRRKRLS